MTGAHTFYLLMLALVDKELKDFLPYEEALKGKNPE